ncbi:glycine cleavage system protein GcvH [Microbacterium sp. UBA3394]|uniref:glycine cleavage system protein GcvH n=1 Tax=Microbacterium sp. UBA3394 TaxID=1946945 RepID=UPI000E8F5010|nr:glycine cleavage system protein GcvH [Microbacterium sp. UBA3394]HAS33255.1 glycine cleavage system protein GcvH [Microbacterium sp.]|tara:strand:+ start:853 stop:1236 length:384 start_codon:yes stop_codon:yes gene_type:complete
MTDTTALKYTAEHEWIALDGDTATVGITAFAAEKLGDIVFVELPGVGSEVSADAVCGEIESTKSVGELYAPLTGTVSAVNDDAVDDPSLVNSDPFGQGWLIKLTVDPAAVDGLLDHEAYAKLTGGQA